MITRDGMVAASVLTGELDEDALAALGAALVRHAVDALAGVQMSDVERLVVVGTRGKIILVDAGSAFLLVVTDFRVRLDVTLLDITGAAYKLRKASCLTV